MSSLKARLPEAKARPTELSRWLQTRKYSHIPQLDSEQRFAEQWMAWWSALQPEWRPSKRKGGLPMAFKKNESRRLIGLRKGGPNGLVTVLIGLKWWKGCDGVPWDAAVKDVRECLERCVTVTAAGQKRGADGSDEKGERRQKKKKV